MAHLDPTSNNTYYIGINHNVNALLVTWIMILTITKYMLTATLPICVLSCNLKHIVLSFCIISQPTIKLVSPLIVYSLMIEWFSMSNIFSNIKICFGYLIMETLDMWMPLSFSSPMMHLFNLWKGEKEDIIYWVKREFEFRIWMLINRK